MLTTFKARAILLAVMIAATIAIRCVNVAPPPLDDPEMHLDQLGGPQPAPKAERNIEATRNRVYGLLAQAEEAAPFDPDIAAAAANMAWVEAWGVLPEQEAGEVIWRCERIIRKASQGR